jgi:hypothetical protein
LKGVASACAVAIATLICAPSVLAQTPAPSAAPVAAPLPPGPKLVLLPYEAPGSTDPHAGDITKELAADLFAAGVVAAPVEPVDHLDAIAGAAKICADNGATGILVPEGRYEQTQKIIPAPFVTILRYPTHVEMRLDDVGCDGKVRWTTTTTGDEAPSGAFSVGNLGSYVDAAFRTAAKAAAVARGAATIPPSAVATSAAPPAAAPATIASYLLLPVEEPGIADPRGPDISHSLLTQLQARKLDVKMGTSIDHVTAVTSAPQLCAAGGTQAIIVPNVRVEQSSFNGRSHAQMRLALLSCGGGVMRHGVGEADMGSGFIRNFGAAVVGVSERAMIPAIDQLFPSTAAPAPSPSP